MGATILNVNSQLRSLNCYSCGTTFGMESGFYEDRLRDHKTFWCPNGHQQHFIGETEAEKLRKLLEAERNRVDFYRRENQSERRSKAAIKGQLTKTKNRIAKGVCPCCNRQFQDLHQHMETKHPDYASNDT